MSHADALTTLEDILAAENAALARHDPEAAVAFVARKLAAAQLLSAEAIEPERLGHLRALAAENKDLLERAIGVQSQIIDMVVRAAQGTPRHTRYGAAGRTVQDEGSKAMARQA